MKADNTKGYKVFQPLLLGISMAIGIALGMKMSDKSNQSHWVQKVDNQLAPVGEVEEIIRFIENKYVDSLERKHLVEVATNAIINELDSYCEYVKKHGEHTIERTLNGLGEGLGIRELKYNERFYVYDVFDKSAAFLAGVQKGDQIIAFNGQKLNNQRAVETKLDWFENAKIGEQCELLVVRDFGKDTMNFTLTKNYGTFLDETPAYKLDDNTAYIRIDQFSKDSYRRFMNHFEHMYDEKPFENIVIDIRGNTGGYVHEAINIVNQFFDKKGDLLLTTINKSQKETIYNTTGRNYFPIKQLIVLIDESSASASEILASVVQDWDVGVVIGRPSFGKGLVQEQFSLSNGDKLRLSVARYITPIGRRIFKDSIEGGAFVNKEFKSKKEGRILYSGKVIPDISVEPSPFEKVGMKDYIQAITDNSIFYQMYTENDFVINFDSNPVGYQDSLVQEVLKYVQMDRAFDEEELAELALLARGSYIKHTNGVLAYQQYANQEDKYIKKVMEELSK